MKSTLTSNVWLHRFAVLTATATMFLIIVGGTVTSTDSGDAVPDWWFIPISFEMANAFPYIPRMVGGVLVEHGHRLVATFVGILTIILAVWLYRKESRKWVRNLGFIAVLAVIVQGTLGGVRVLLGTEPAFRTGLAIVHACLAQAFFCITVALALFTSNLWLQKPSSSGFKSSFPRMATLTTIALFVQLVLGALMRHTGKGLLIHIGFAFVASLLVLHTGTVSLCLSKSASLFWIAILMVGLLLIQIGLGMGTYYLVANGFVRSISADTFQLAVITAHLATGALLLATSFVLTLIVRKEFFSLNNTVLLNISSPVGNS